MTSRAQPAAARSGGRTAVGGQRYRVAGTAALKPEPVRARADRVQPVRAPGDRVQPVRTPGGPKQPPRARRSTDAATTAPASGTRASRAPNRAGGQATAVAPAAGRAGWADSHPLRVAPPAPVSAPRAPFVLAVLFVVIVGVLGVLVLNTRINQNAFRLHDLRSQQSGLDQREQQLESEIAQRQTPNRLAAAARQLGMVRADTPAYLRLPNGQVVGVPRPAAGAPSVTGGQNAAPAAAAADQPAG